MNEFWKYFLANFRGFSAAEYVLLLVAVLIIAGAAIVFLRWLFESRFKAQQDLLGLKEAMIAAVRQQLEIASTEADRVRTEAAEYRARVDEAQKQKSEMDAKLGQMSQAASLASQYANDVQNALGLAQLATIMCVRLLQLYQILALYESFNVPERVPGTPTTRSLFARLQAMYSTFKQLPQTMAILAEEHARTHEPVPAEQWAERLFTESLDNEIDTLWVEMHDNIQRAIEPDQQHLATGGPTPLTS